MSNKKIVKPTTTYAETVTEIAAKSDISKNVLLLNYKLITSTKA